jgi:hypothetical protein
MTRRYTGGFLSATEQATDSNTANGIYTLQEAGQATAVGNFPTGGWTPSRSLRFRSSAGAYLNKSYGADGNRKTWTLSFWIKRGKIESDQHVWSSAGVNHPGGADIAYIGFTGDDRFITYMYPNGGPAAYYVGTNKVFRDPAAWYHIVVNMDTTQATSTNRIKIYVNGAEETSLQNTSYPSLDYASSYINSTRPQVIGHEDGRWRYAVDGYMTEVNFIDGQALTPSAFGQTDPTIGQWEPKRYTGTYGTNGFYLDFRDNSAATATTLGADRSGNGNNFTPNNFSVTTGVTYDSMVDVPGIASVSSQTNIGGVQRGNYATLNPLSIYVVNPTDGNLKFSGNSAGGIGSIGVSSGKYYWETVYTAIGSNEGVIVGIRSMESVGTGAAENVGYYGGGSESGRKIINGGILDGGTTAYGATWTTGDVIGVALNLDANEITFYKNGVSQGAIAIRFTPGTKTWTSFNWRTGPASSANTGTINFGQSPFAYTPPVGFKSINTTNLPNPVIKRPEQHFGVRTWVGNGSNITLGVTAKESPAYPIERSLKFNASASGHLTRTPATASNRRTWTYSAWIKRSVLGTRQSIFSGGTGNTTGQPGGGVYFASSTNTLQYVMGGGTTCLVTTARPFTDTTAWMHLVIAMDTTQVVPSQRLRMYVDGVQITSFSDTTYPSQNFETDVNNAVIHAIGSRTDDGTIPNTVANYYLAEVNFIDGTAKVPSDFGAYDANNNWVPQRYTGTYGTNGFYLPMKQSGATGFNAVTFNVQNGFNKISGVGFNPDLVWLKRRNSSQDHFIVDSLRGGTKLLRANTTAAETTYSTPNWITSFDADGFTSHTDSLVTTGSQYVAWCWDAGTSTVTNTSGSNSAQVRANTTAGFSVVTYTGTGSNATVGHGLGVAPKVIIIKGRGNTDNWIVYNAYISNPTTYALLLNSNIAPDNDPNYFNSTAPTSTVFSVGTDASTNQNTVGFVAYCFSEVAGFSKFGSYTGNGSSTGPTITLGFRPAFVMVKRTDTTGNWVVFDSTRSNTNTRSNAVSFDLSDREYGAADGVGGIDFTATGFQLRDTHTTRNENAGTYTYMAFAETRANVFGKDNSSNGNDWQPGQGVGAATDVVLDSPADGADSSGNIIGNYAVLNSGEKGSVVTVSNGGLGWAQSTTTAQSIRATLPMPTGKWYWELNAASNNSPGIMRQSGSISAYCGSDTKGWSYFVDGTLYNNNSNVSFGATHSVSDIISVAFDADTGKLWFAKNGTWQASGDPATGANAIMVPLDPNDLYYPAVSTSVTGAVVGTVNFGQTPFTYTPPTGFKALNSKNLKDVGSFNLPDSFGNFASTPDLAWMKSRTNGSYRHQWLDTVRGPRNVLFSSDNTEQQTFESVQSFIPNGVTLGPEAGTNELGGSHAGWFWNRGKTPGFDIVTYGGDGVNTRMIPHNLGQVPAFYITKCLTNYNNAQSFADWSVYHKDCPTYTGNSRNGKQALWLHRDLAAANGVGGFFNIPTSSEFGPNQINYDNSAGQSYVAYLWAEVPGFSQFGSYVGNGSTDGPFVYTGFKPAFILTKNITTAGYWWEMVDNKRAPFNPSNKTLYANVTDTEYSGSGYNKDLLSNGFKMRGTSAGHNSSGDTFVYAAFAENPFKYGNAR